MQVSSNFEQAAAAAAQTPPQTTTNNNNNNSPALPSKMAFLVAALFPFTTLLECCCFFCGVFYMVIRFLVVNKQNGFDIQAFLYLAAWNQVANANRCIDTHKTFTQRRLKLIKKPNAFDRHSDYDYYSRILRHTLTHTHTHTDSNQQCSLTFVIPHSNDDFVIGLKSLTHSLISSGCKLMKHFLSCRFNGNQLRAF